MAELTVSAGMARTLLEFAGSRGAAMPALIARSGVDPTLLDDHDNRVPFATYVALMRAAKDLCADEAFALHFAEAVALSEFSLVGLIVYASETMMEGLWQCNRYGRLVIEVDLDQTDRFALVAEAEGLWVVDGRKNPNAFPELTETTFGRTVAQPRRFLPRPLVLEMHVTHAAPAYRAEYERIFQCPVVFESRRNALRVDPEMMKHKMQQEPRFVFGILCARADELLAELERSKSARGRVESLLMPVLHMGDAHIDAVAARMEISRQTLYRHLKAEGTTFEQVLDDLRRRMALSYLSGGKVSVNETAYLVGFSETAAFSRAFKRWTGKSPSDARPARR